MSECVKVIVRCRPMNSKEKNLQCAKIIKIDQRILQVSITKPRILGSEIAAGKVAPVIKDDNAGEFEPKSFTFDGVYDDDSNQREVYEDTALPLLQSVLEGYNGTIFAYGQTGCGKTFTMEGVRGVPELRGIIPTTFASVFDSINQNAAPGRQFLVRASYLEIYNEEVRDLTSDNPKLRCDIKEDKDKGVYVKGLVSAEVRNEADLEALMAKGNANRTVGATLMNADSSRSHSIFCITVECSEPDTAKGGDEVKIKQGKLNLVDLAGSERQSKTQAEGVRLKEATKINLSLSALGNVIEALVANASGKARHIPYRDSKLTRLLQDSLGGNTKTIMIAAISPADYNFDETLSTLRYANRAKNIKNKPKVNEDPKDALLREYQDEIKRLKMILEEKGLGDLLAALPGAKPAAAAAKPKGSAPTKPLTITDGSAAAGTLSVNSSPRPVEPLSARSEASVGDQQELNSDSVAVATALSGTEMVEREAELAEDLDRLADEKHHHERLAAVIEMELANRAEEAVQLEAEKHEIDERIASEAAAGKSEVVALLEAEKSRLEADQLAQANETATLKASMAAEKAEHEARASELAKQMEDKLAEESARRQEIEEKLTFIKQKTVKEKEALKSKLALLQQKLISGHERIKDIKNEQEEQMRAMKERERTLRAEQAQLEQERRKKEEQDLLIEEQYANKEAELTDTREKLSKLQRRYRALAAEKNEMEEIMENEKAQSNNQIRELERETRLYQMIVQKLLTNTDLELITRQAYYDDSRDTWQLPHIDMPMCFPTVSTAHPHAAHLMPDQAQSNERYQMKSNYQSSSPAPQTMPWKRDHMQASGPTGSSVLDRLHSRAYREAIDRQPSAYVERVGPGGWKRSVLAGMSSADLEVMAKDPRSRADPRYVTRAPKQVSPAEARAATVAVSENIEAITAGVKRRDAFKVQDEAKEAMQGMNQVDIQELDAQVKKRPAFQPAKLVSPGASNNNQQALPESAFNVPSRPAFAPAAHVVQQSTSPGLDLDSLPKGRPAFTPAAR